MVREIKKERGWLWVLIDGKRDKKRERGWLWVLIYGKRDKKRERVIVSSNLW